MPSTVDGGALASESSAALPSAAGVPFKRRFVMPSVVLAVLEIVAVGYPLWVAFDLSTFGADTLLRTALPVGVIAIIVWVTATTVWLMPLWRAAAARRRGDKVSKDLATRAYRITLKGPVR